MPTFTNTRVLSPTVTLSFEWSGGVYIEVSRRGQVAVEVINVWDYEADRPRVEVSLAGFSAAIDAWIADYGVDDLVHDVVNNW